ncbi:MAG: hypothetical protein QM813_20760 [Verrucomicrobiota bacterium]
MKRWGLIIVAILLLLLGAVLLTPDRTPSTAPRFIAGKSQPPNDVKWSDYDWLTLRPFVNDKMWIFGIRFGTNHFNYLYDLRERLVVGELRNAGVELVNGDGTKVLVVGADSPAVGLKSKLFALLQRISGGRIKSNVDRTESFWLVNLKDNTTHRVGAVTQFPGLGSRWYTSPGLRYGCTVPTTEQNAFVLFDFETERYARVSQAGRIRGWWDEQRILLHVNDRDFVLYDVVQQKTNLFFSAAELQQTLKDAQLPDDPANVDSFANWNGREYDFYFVERDYEYRAKRCFLLKVDRSKTPPVLKVVSREFQFAWGGTFNPDASRYLFQGETGASGSGGNGAVYLRDLTDNSERTLVPPDNKGQYAIPRFFGNEVIYFRDRAIWRIGQDGQHNVPLFPSAAVAP